MLDQLFHVAPVDGEDRWRVTIHPQVANLLALGLNYAQQQLGDRMEAERLTPDTFEDPFEEMAWRERSFDVLSSARERAFEAAGGVWQSLQPTADGRLSGDVARDVLLSSMEAFTHTRNVLQNRLSDGEQSLELHASFEATAIPIQVISESQLS